MNPQALDHSVAQVIPWLHYLFIPLPPPGPILDIESMDAFLKVHFSKKKGIFFARTP